MENSSQDVNLDSPLSALGLQRIGEKKPPTPNKETNLNLNRRGMPVRIRKKNKIYFDDDVITTSPAKTKSPKKPPSTKIFSPRKASGGSGVISRPLPLPTPPPLSPLFSPSPPSPPKALPCTLPAISSLKMEAQESKFIKELSAPATTVSSACNLTLMSPNKKVAQSNGFRLRNFLKLPQAHKWVYFEWFYSNIDKPLFQGENDFEVVLKEAFPHLAARKLSRRQWGFVRRMMGKPRRCSQAFFSEERVSLLKRRQVLRLLQQRKLTDVASLKELPLPSHIPMQLVVGMKVTARLRKPDNGLYTGVINAVDTSNNTYRISFDRHGIGTHSVPDFEVLSNEGCDMMSLSSYTHQFRPRFHYNLVTPPRPILPKSEPRLIAPKLDSPTGALSNDPILAQSPNRPSYKFNVDDSIGGFSVQSLIDVISLSKILKAKREKVDLLKKLNEEAEMTRSFGREMPLEFQRKYAGLILDMEVVNRDLNETLLKVQDFCQDIAPDEGLPGPTLLPRQIRERCYEEAAAVVDLTNLSSGSEQVVSPSILHLITKLTSIMLQLKNITENEVSAFEINSLEETMTEIRSSLHEGNKLHFENNVEVHLSHVISAVSQVGTLQAFNAT